MTITKSKRFLHMIYHSCSICAMVWIIWYSFSLSDIQPCKCECISNPYLIKATNMQTKSVLESSPIEILVEKKYTDVINHCLQKKDSYVSTTFSLEGDTSDNNDNNILTLQTRLFNCIKND